MPLSSVDLSSSWLHKSSPAPKKSTYSIKLKKSLLKLKQFRSCRTRLVRTLLQSSPSQFHSDFRSLDESLSKIVQDYKNFPNTNLLPTDSEIESIVLAPTERLLHAAYEISCLRQLAEVITFSPKVFVPLTRLCRDTCGYCSFAVSPRQLKEQGISGGRAYLREEEVLRLAREGWAMGCTEVLFTLGDKPELRYQMAREELSSLGFSSTVEYLAHVSGRVLRETGMLPHVNAGALSTSELALLKSVSASQGLMLEQASPRLSHGVGSVHFLPSCPDKEPSLRLAVIEDAGRLSIPFTTGILIGIGETRRERILSLLAIRSLHQKYNHIGEIIIQNFQPHPGTSLQEYQLPEELNFGNPDHQEDAALKKASRSEIEFQDLLWTIAVSRILFGPNMSIQSPPNLVVPSTSLPFQIPAQVTRISSSLFPALFSPSRNEELTSRALSSRVLDSSSPKSDPSPPQRASPPGSPPVAPFSPPPSPDLSDFLSLLIYGGVNDFGGISPLTKDWVNEEFPWPTLSALSDACSKIGGKTLVPRLPLYPSHVLFSNIENEREKERDKKWSRAEEGVGECVENQGEMVSQGSTGTRTAKKERSRGKVGEEKEKEEEKKEGEEKEEQKATCSANKWLHNDVLPHVLALSDSFGLSRAQLWSPGIPPHSLSSFPSSSSSSLRALPFAPSTSSPFSSSYASFDAQTFSSSSSFASPSFSPSLTLSATEEFLFSFESSVREYLSGYDYLSPVLSPSPSTLAHASVNGGRSEKQETSERSEGESGRVEVGADGTLRLWTTRGKPRSWGEEESGREKEREEKREETLRHETERGRLRRIRRKANQLSALVLSEGGRNSGFTESEVSRMFTLRGEDFLSVCLAADTVRREACGEEVSFVVNRNINYTNICSLSCDFCAFSKAKVAEDGKDPPYLLPLEEIARRGTEAVQSGATELCLQGGIHPSFTGETYLSILSSLSSSLSPSLPHIHAFSPLEVMHGARTSGVSVERFLTLLRNKGLGSLPGTAAEILDDDIRSLICPEKISTSEWVHVMRTAHSVGLPSTSTIMFGHRERETHWARHLLVLRSLQQETSGFTEFVPLPFVHMQAPMYLKGLSRKGPSLRESILMHAVARLVLFPHFTNIQASWVKMGSMGVKPLLLSGCNDVGGTLMNESISRAAGAKFGQGLTPTELRQLIIAANRVPVQRTTLYKSVD